MPTSRKHAVPRFERDPCAIIWPDWATGTVHLEMQRVNAPLEPAPSDPAPLELDEPDRPYLIAAWVIAAFLLWFVLRFDLLPALLAGLLVFELVHVLTLRSTFVRERRARILAVAFIAMVVVGLLSLMIFGAVLFFRSDSGGYVLLLKKSAEVIQSWRHLIPEWMAHSMPADGDALQNRVVGWLQQHAAAVQTAGREATHIFVRIVIGMVIGALVALRQADPPVRYRWLPLYSDRSNAFVAVVGPPDWRGLLDPTPSKELVLEVGIVDRRSDQACDAERCFHEQHGQ